MNNNANNIYRIYYKSEVNYNKRPFCQSHDRAAKCAIVEGVDAMTAKVNELTAAGIVVNSIYTGTGKKVK